MSDAIKLSQLLAAAEVYAVFTSIKSKGGEKAKDLAATHAEALRAIAPVLVDVLHTRHVLMASDIDRDAGQYEGLVIRYNNAWVTLVSALAEEGVTCD